LARNSQETEDDMVYSLSITILQNKLVHAKVLSTTHLFATGMDPLADSLMFYHCKNGKISAITKYLLKETLIAIQQNFPALVAGDCIEGIPKMTRFLNSSLPACQ
jgi:hypothetical protein